MISATSSESDGGAVQLLCGASPQRRSSPSPSRLTSGLGCPSHPSGQGVISRTYCRMGSPPVSSGGPHFSCGRGNGSAHGGKKQCHRQPWGTCNTCNTCNGANGDNLGACSSGTEQAHACTGTGTGTHTTHLECVARPLRQGGRLHRARRRRHGAEQLQRGALGREGDALVVWERGDGGAARAHGVEPAGAQGGDLRDRFGSTCGRAARAGGRGGTTRPAFGGTCGAPLAKQEC
jgi:hypothetical protein